MGQVKIAIERIKEKSRRGVTYFKRLQGVMKKARELSTLCDVDLAVIVFSAMGEFKPAHYCREDRIEQVVAQFASLSQQEKRRAKYMTPQNVKSLKEEVEEGPGLEAVSSSSEEQQSMNQMPGNEVEVYEQQIELYAAENLKLREQLKSCTEQNDILTREGIQSYFSNADGFISGLSMETLEVLEKEVQYSYSKICDRRKDLMKGEAHVQFSDLGQQGVEQELLDRAQALRPNCQMEGVDGELLASAQATQPNGQMEGVDQGLPDSAQAMLPSTYQMEERLGGYAEESCPEFSGGPAMSHELHETNPSLVGGGEAPSGYLGLVTYEPKYFEPVATPECYAPGLNVASSSEALIRSYLVPDEIRDVEPGCEWPQYIPSLWD